MGLLSKAAAVAVAAVVLADPTARAAAVGAAGPIWNELRTEVGYLATERASGGPGDSAQPQSSAAKTAQYPSGAAQTRAGTATAAREAARPAALTPAPGALGSKSGATHFLFTDRGPDGAPARWSSCTPLRLIVNPAGAPKGAVGDLRTAAARISAVTGLTMKVTTTTATSVPNWGSRQRAGYPGWAPALVTWGHPNGVLDPDASATTEPTFATNSAGREVIVSGQIRINVEHDDYYTPGFGQGNSRVALYMHELGHLVGLEHVSDPHQLMYPAMGNARDFGAGDLAGLRKAGAGGCVKAPTPSWK